MSESDLFDAQDDQTHTVDENISGSINGKLMAFKNFLNNPAFINPSGSKTTLIIDRTTGTCYKFPEGRIPTFMTLVNELYVSGVKSCMLMERQLEYSGIMDDFDIKQPKETSQINEEHFLRYCQKKTKLLKEYIDLCDTENGRTKMFKTKIAFIKKIKPTYKDEHKCYGDGFHALIPGVKLRREVKRFLHDKQIEQNDIDFIFGDVKTIDSCEASDIYDKNSCHVPVALVGSKSKPKSEPYKLVAVFDVCIYLDSDDPATIKRADYFLDENKYSHPYELSLNWEKENGAIKKYQCEVKPNYAKFIAVGQQFNEEETVKFQDKTFGALSMLRKNGDIEVSFIKKLLDIINPERANPYDTWWEIVCTLASISHSYKPLAEYFSKKYLTRFDPVKFEADWDRATKMKLTRNIGSLIHIAKSDNPGAYSEVMKTSLLNSLYETIYMPENVGHLSHNAVSKLLKRLLKHKFAFDYPRDSRTGYWYEFIADGEQYTYPGEAWKWRRYANGVRPPSMSRYMSEQLPALLSKTLDKIKENISNSQEEKLLQAYHKNVYNNFRKSIQNMGNNGFKKQVISEAECEFEQTGFSATMDADPNVIGVSNGVLVLPTPKNPHPPELHTGYHGYRVSIFTLVNYYEFNPYDPVTAEILVGVRNLFADDEPDTHNFFMHYWASALDHQPKESIMVIVVGNGCNGKTAIFELVKNALGPYCINPPPSYILDTGLSDADKPSPLTIQFKNCHAANFSEFKEKVSLDLVKIKRFTGGDTMSGRTLFDTVQTEFKPATLMTACSNYDFVIRSNDHGTWRRIIRIEFKIKFIRTWMGEKLNKNSPYERPANASVLNKWTTDKEYTEKFFSCLTYYHEQLMRKYEGKPTKVPHPNIDHATEVFRNEQDTVNNFICLFLVKDMRSDEDRKQAEDATVIDEKEREREEESRTFYKIVDLYNQWYIANDPSAKNNRDIFKNVKSAFENSSLFKYFTRNDSGNYVLESGYRILKMNEKPNSYEKHVAISQGKEYKNTQRAETAEQYLQRIRDEWDLEHKKPEKKEHATDLDDNLAEMYKKDAKVRKSNKDLATLDIQVDTSKNDNLEKYASELKAKLNESQKSRKEDTRKSDAYVLTNLSNSPPLKKISNQEVIEHLARDPDLRKKVNKIADGHTTDSDESGDSGSDNESEGSDAEEGMKSKNIILASKKKKDSDSEDE